MTPAFDRDGYPTEWTLEAIESWPAVPRHDWYKLLNFMQAAWRDSYGRVTHGGRSWEFITGGWSGNESIIAALRQNIVAWSRLWVLSERGGRYVFEEPE